jgi:hypothetical protein
MKLLLLVLFILSGCGEDNFEKQSELKGLRVLAITANTPEINTSAGVNLTPLISYVSGGNTTLNYSWEACPDPGIDFGADADCNDSIAALKLTGGSTFNTAGLVGTYYTGNATPIVVTIPVAAFSYLATLDSNIQYNGLDYLVFITYVDQANGKSTRALKRIKITTKAPGELNSNPSFTNIQFNGGNLVAFPGVKGNMGIAGYSAAQNYSLQTNVGLKALTESTFVSWYSSKGKFLFSRTEANITNEYEPSGSTGVFVGVYRDGRGGIATQLVSF